MCVVKTPSSPRLRKGYTKIEARMKPLLQSSGQAPVDIKHHRDIMLYFLKPSSGVFTENVWFWPGKKMMHIQTCHLWGE